MLRGIPSKTSFLVPEILGLGSLRNVPGPGTPISSGACIPVFMVLQSLCVRTAGVIQYGLWRTVYGVGDRYKG